MGNGEWGMANGEWRMANGEWRMANGEWGMGNLEWEMWSGEWGVGSGGMAAHLLTLSMCPALRFRPVRPAAPDGLAPSELKVPS